MKIERNDYRQNGRRAKNGAYIENIKVVYENYMS
jgi:hypothetical protein